MLPAKPVSTSSHMGLQSESLDTVILDDLYSFLKSQQKQAGGSTRLFEMLEKMLPSDRRSFHKLLPCGRGGWMDILRYRRLHCTGSAARNLAAILRPQSILCLHLSLLRMPVCSPNELSQCTLIRSKIRYPAWLLPDTVVSSTAWTIL